MARWKNWWHFTTTMPHLQFLWSMALTSSCKIWLCYIRCRSNESHSRCVAERCRALCNYIIRPPCQYNAHFCSKSTYYVKKCLSCTVHHASIRSKIYEFSKLVEFWCFWSMWKFGQNLNQTLWTHPLMESSWQQLSRIYSVFWTVMDLGSSAAFVII